MSSPKGPRKLLAKISRLLEDLKIPYLVTGGWAVTVWGRPRFTADIDLVIKISLPDIDGLVKALQGLAEEGYIDRGMVEEALETQGEFNYISPTGIKVDFFVLPETAFGESQLARGVSRRILGESVRFISPEDLILVKLLWHRESGSEKQLTDAHSVLEISAQQLDGDYLRKWARKLGVEELFNEISNDAEIT